MYKTNILSYLEKRELGYGGKVHLLINTHCVFKRKL